MRLRCLVSVTMTILALISTGIGGEPTVSARAPIRIVLDGAHRPGDCMAEGMKLRDELRTLAYPPGWTLAIMCTPVRWEALLRSADIRNTSAAFTRISERITVFNGAIFREFPPRYRHIMAHELAHIQCDCRDEVAADKLAGKLEKISVPMR